MKFITQKKTFFRIAIVASLIIYSINIKVKAQEDLNIIQDKWLKYSDAGNSLYHYLAEQANDLCEARVEEVAKVKTKGEWSERQKKMRQRIWDAVGPFPEKTLLHAKTISAYEKGGIRVENVIYESLPGFYVTASLFIPENLKKPAPAILFCSGHSSAVYRLQYYQQPLLNLVKKGFVVLAIDPIGQGERLQYYDPETGKSRIGGSTLEHSYSGVQVFLTGHSIARYFIWDGIRGIDYLVSRPEVDSKRIGVHGLSGGGTQTAYISALDDRVVAAAPACYITSYKRLMESIGPQDGEQNFYHGLRNGIDHADLLEVRAPKPTLIMANTRDFFPIQGVRETYQEVKKVYGIFGKPDNLSVVESDHGHGYTRKNREAMYAFFQKYLHQPGSSAEEDVEFFLPEELQKTKTGQVSTSLGGETVFSLNKKEARVLDDNILQSRKNLSGHINEILQSAKKLSGYQEPDNVKDPVFTGRYQRDGYVVEKYFVQGEGNYVIPYLLMIPEKSNNKALIYLHPRGKRAEAAPGREMEWFVKKGFTVLAPDLIGTGEMGPGDFKGDAYINGISFNIWFSSVIIGRSVVGIRASDVIRLVRILEKNDNIRDIYGFARSVMTPVMLYAAAFDPSVKRVALVQPYSSYRSIVTNRYYNPAFVFGLVPGALTAYDLPDLAASLAPRKLLIAGIENEDGTYIDPKMVEQDFGVIERSYHLKKADEQMKVVKWQSLDKTYYPYDLYLEWIK